MRKRMRRQRINGSYSPTSACPDKDPRIRIRIRILVGA